MSNQDSRELVLRLPKEINRFFKDQVRFLTKNGQKEPMQALVRESLFLLQSLTAIAQSETSTLTVKGSLLIEKEPLAFNFNEILDDFRLLRPQEEYLIEIPSDFWPIFDEICLRSPCTTYEEVLFCSFYAFRLILGVIKRQANILVLYIEEGELKEEVYVLPLLNLYKAHVYH